MNKTPPIKAGDVRHLKLFGTIEIDENEIHICLIKHKGIMYFVSGSVCNAGLIAEHAMEYDASDGIDSALQEFIAELESDCPSDELLEFYGSLVI